MTMTAGAVRVMFGKVHRSMLMMIASLLAVVLGDVMGVVVVMMGICTAMR